MSLVETVLPVLDTLDLATEHIGDAESADGRALLAVAGQLHDVLAKEGLERDRPARRGVRPQRPRGGGPPAATRWRAADRVTPAPASRWWVR